MTERYGKTGRYAGRRGTIRNFDRAVRSWARMLAVTILVTGALLFAGMFGGMDAMAGGTDVCTTKYYTSIQIAEGDTLWSIARKYNENSGISDADYITELCRMNSLAGTQIHKGHYLTVAYYR